MDDYEAEGHKACTWYLADCPYSQQKIRDAWQRGAWKWQQEQRARRPSSAHATRARSGPHAQMHEPGALRTASDRQLRGFYRDEKRDVARARAEATRRGLSPLHARKKSPSRLDREIAEWVPSWGTAGSTAQKRRPSASRRKV